MKARIDPGNLLGTITAPPSKSMTQRVYAAALLHHGVTTIHNAGTSDDENAALQVIRQLGATVRSHPGGIMEITSKGVNPVSASIPCGESGLAARLFTAIAALADRPIRVEGHGTLLSRPMDNFGDVLPALSVDLKDFDGYLPYTVHGPLRPGTITVDARSGSQFLSGLLFAFSGSAQQPVSVVVTGLKSRPYIDLTLQVLAHFGKPVQREGYNAFHFDPSQFDVKEDVEVCIEGDWSGASAFLVAGAIAGDITVQNLSRDSLQADRAIADVLQAAGAHISWGEGSLRVRHATLHAFEFDATHAPDLFPSLAILGAHCIGESAIRGVHRLFDKESNRVESVTEMLYDFGVPFSVENDTLFITGVSKLRGTIIDSYHDHRIVMAAAVGALSAAGPVDISFAEAVSKSYPGFFNDFIMCGGSYTFINN